MISPAYLLCSGLPVGNLFSQFFANVYLPALDQFVQHTLKVRHYVRYKDDFVLLANSVRLRRSLFVQFPWLAQYFE